MIDVKQATVESAELIFYYPITYSMAKREQLITTAQQHGFSFFHIEDEPKKEYYAGHAISHEGLTQFFYPFIEDKLFPNHWEDRGFSRFSKAWNTDATMHVRGRTIPFTISSVDLIVCPFGIAFIVIRTALRHRMTATDALDFCHFFRVLVPHVKEEKGATITYNEAHYRQTDELIRQQFLPFLSRFFVDYEKLGDEYSHMPFFEDERMFVSGFVRLEEGTQIDDVLLFRIGQLDGTDAMNEPFVSASNMGYIEQYIEAHVLKRWAPQTYRVTSNRAHMQVTTQSEHDAYARVCEFYSVDYYTVVLNYFYKIMLLKLTFEHSEIRWGKEKFVVDELIERITKFSSRYYFDEVIVRSEGREASALLRKHFRITEQYKEIKATLEELYRLQEDQEDERQSTFLFILTVYTVVSGIYGMNVVIDDWKGSIDWGKLAGYTVFEWIAWVLGITGIVLSFTIVGRTAYRGLQTFGRKYRRKKYE
ncbi:MAG: hypothetical protein KIG60_09135 [Caryophanon sp.]|nr:hypothetical protein [Caryophanon sp.]